MSTRNGNSPAYARPASVDPTNGTLSDGDDVAPEQTGLTKRELIAAMALQGILSHPDSDYSRSAEMAVKRADALLAELERSRS
jgi:hypothetical protein